MSLKVLKTEEEYQRALQRLDAVFDAPVNSLEGDEAEILYLLIEKYEEEHYPIAAPDPIEAIKFRMEQMDMTKTELAALLGYKSSISDLFTRKRKLNLAMIRTLHEKLNIPYEALLMKY